MAGTRSSARQAANAAPSSSPASSQSQPNANKGSGAGSKRKAASTTASPQPKKGRKGSKKEQTTIEDTLPNQGTEEPKDEPKDEEMKDEPQGLSADPSDLAPVHDDSKEETKKEDSVTANGEGAKETPQEATRGESEQNADADIKQNGEEAGQVSTGGDAVEESSKREESIPSSILEKGIIYFFFRGRVGINEPSDVNDIARSYIILRPLPHGAKLGDGPIGDAGNNRMLALPKKVLPVSPKDRFMTFVEKTNVTMEEIKDSLSASDYMTKTAGSRHTPAAAPIGEGVYAITSTGRETHLAYILTIPSEISEVQQDVGLRQRGSYLTSAKNPTTSAPAGANLPKGAEYPKE